MIPGLSNVVIQSETNPLRFETFCRELCGKRENVDLLPTSITYDQGRDARSIGSSRRSHRTILCATINKDLDDKIEHDLNRLAQTSAPEHLIYCSAQNLTELKLDQLKQQIQDYFSYHCHVDVMGSVQLASLAERYPEILNKHYPAEIRTIETTLLNPSATSEGSIESSGLRIALLAFAAEDSKALRRSVSKCALSEILLRQGPITEIGIAEKLSADLGLPKAVNPDYVRTILRFLREDQLAIESNGTWSLTKSGKEKAESSSRYAAKELLEGRILIRQKLKDLLGTPLSDQQFATIWDTLLDFLSELFYSNGLAIVRAVNAVFESTSGAADGTDFDRLLARGAAKIRNTVTSTQLGEEIEQAVLDMFRERSGSAFDWLARVCERFVALCALGLESQSADAMRNVLRRSMLVIDSDIVLTLLCDAEPDHESVQDLIARWRRAGGKVLLSPIVLAEVANHAWISERDYRETICLLGKLERGELRRYVENAFVRTFHSLAKDSSHQRHWYSYIHQFRGKSEEDYSQILTILQTELGADLAPSNYDTMLRDDVNADLHDLLAADRGIDPRHLSKKETDKAWRDAQLLASIANNREAQRQVGSANTVFLLSSSIRLRRVDNKFRARLGSPYAVVSRAALSYMLSLIPDVQLGADSLRRALFTFGEAGHLPDSERIALRAIRASEEYEFPWAKRRTLHAQLENAFHSEARKRGIPVDEVRSQFDEGNEAARPAEIIRSALQNVGISDRQTESLRDASRKIATLEAQVRNLNEALKEVRRSAKRGARKQRRRSARGVPAAPTRQHESAADNAMPNSESVPPRKLESD